MAGARKSAKYIFFGNFFSKGITFIGSIFLARILFPEDYGYLLIAMIVTGFAQMLSSMGFENFYLQEKIKDEKHEAEILNITFKLRVFVNLLMFLVQYFCSYPISNYYDEPIVGELLRIFSFSYIFTAFVQTNLYILRKKVDFRPEVLANILRDIAGTTVKVFLAWSGFGALSFAYGSLLGTFLWTITILYFQRFLPDMKYWNKAIFLKVFYFGKHSLIAGIAGYLSAYIDKILLTNTFPISQVGGYSFAFGQSDNIKARLTRPMGSLVVSYIAKYKGNNKKIIETLASITYFELVVMIPIYIFFLIYAESIVYYIFGEKWVFTVSVMQVFLIYGLLSTIAGSAINLLTGLGYPQILSNLSIKNLLVLFISLSFIVFISDNIVLYASVFSIINFLYILFKANAGLSKIDISFGSFLRKIYIKEITIYLIIVLFFALSINFFIRNDIIAMPVTIITMFIIFLILQGIVFEKIFTNSLSVIVGSNHKVYNFFRRLSQWSK